MRLTPERERVVAAVYDSDDEFAADQWIDSLTGHKGSMLTSRSTVYRTLSLLEEAGLIRKVTRKDGHEVYRLIDGTSPPDFLPQG